MSDISIQGQNESINATVAFNTYETYSWINNAQFYPLVPPHYYDYYNRFVRKYFYWYDGFDPNFHSQYSGIFSTRLAYTLCSKLSGLVNGGTLMFDNPNILSNKKAKYKKNGKTLDALEFIETWAKDVNLTNKSDTGISYSFAGGDSAIKLNSNGTDVYPTILRKDNYVVDVDFSGKVTGFTGAVYTYTKMRKDSTNENRREDYYYLLEEREYIDDKPMYRVFVKVGYGNVTTNKEINFDSIQAVKWEELSKDVRKAIKSNYGDITLDKWYDMPIPSLGIYLLKNSEAISFLPQLPFGESLLSNQITNLQLYDYLKSFVGTEMYIARGRVMLPEAMQSPHKESTSNQYDGLDSMLYNMIKYVNPAEQKPMPLQFELRADQIDKIEKVILRNVAMSAQISERTLAGFLADGSERATAREISVDDATATFVENKRTLFRKPLNEMLCDVLAFYNFDDEITVRFSRVGLNNMNEVVTQMVTLKQNNLIDIREAIGYIFVDKNERQLDELASRLEKLDEEKMNEKNEINNKGLGTTDEDYEEQNNNDINHIEKGNE